MSGTQAWLRLMSVAGFALVLMCAGAAWSEQAPVCSEAVPVHVSLAAGSLPLVGKEGTITATVTVDYDLPDVTLELEVTGNGKVVDAPAVALGRMAASGPVDRTFRIMFDTPGNKLVRAVVKAQERPGVVWSAVEYLALNVGATASMLGLGPETEPSAAQKTPGTGTIIGPAPTDALRVSSEQDAPIAPLGGPDVPSAAKPAADTGTLGTFTLSGAWHFNDRNAVYTPQRQVLVEMVRGDTSAHIEWAWTDWDGNYTFPALPNPGAAGVYIICSTWTNYGSGNFLSIIDAGGDEWNNRYTAWTQKLTFADGNQSAGDWYLLDSWANRKAWWIHDDYIKAYYVPQLPAGGVDPTGRHVGRWTPTSTDGTYYNGDAHYAAGDADNTPDTILHEMGHSVMNNIYAGYWPPSPNCNPHYLMGISSTGCAWTEGWAQTWHCWTTGNAIRSYPGGGGIDLEAATWGDGYDQGDQVEGRVAGAIWDITDSTNEGYDKYTGSWADIWWMMRNLKVDTFAQFWTQWKAHGFAKHGPVASIYQSTIDYDTAPTFSGLPDISRNENTTNNNVLDLWLYAYDAESYDWELTYTITGNTNPGCGASVDSAGNLDVNPSPHFHGTSTVTIRCSDGVKTASDSLVITIVQVNDPPTISGLPDRIVGRNSHWTHAIDLWSYATDPYDADSALTYSIVGNTGPSCGAAVVSYRYIDINPVAGWTGESHVTVRVADPDGFWDEDTFVIVVGDMVVSCADARNRADGSWVYTEYLTTVTGVFPSIFYMEDWNRVSGIRVSWADPPPVANYVWAAGQLTSYFGERMINAHIAFDYGVDPTPPAPFYIRNNVMGGASPNAYTRRVPEPNGSVPAPIAAGAYNVGLLARTTGTVVSSSGAFWIDDGSHAVYTPSLSALYVDWSSIGTPAPPVGARVAVTGISGATTFTGNTIAKFRPRSAADLTGLGGKVAYLYDTDPTTAAAFAEMLLPHHWTTSRYAIGRLPSNLSGFDVIIIGGDTGLWSDPKTVAKVVESNRPVVAIGDGGCRFLDQVHKPELNIGWLPSGGGSANAGWAQDTGLVVWYFDQPITIPVGGPIVIQKSGGNYEVYNPPSSVTRIVRDATLELYWPIAQEYRFMQWGFNGGPSVMSATGQQLFVNCLYYMQGQ